MLCATYRLPQLLQKWDYPSAGGLLLL
ncbi:MAG: hypothetical protein RLZZ338_2309, partial [Cyanobacteriota bacterium]